MIERTFIQKNYNKMELENYLSKTIDRAGFSSMELIKTPLVTRIVLHVAKPGLAIGKSGSTIKQLTEVIARDFKIENPQIEIQEVKEPNLDAKILVEKMKSMINRGFSWRSVSFRTVKDIMGAGAQGVELVFKGALGGKGARKRKQRIAIGYMKKIGDQAKLVDSTKASANPKIGAIGIKLSIIHPDVVFPDKIDVKKVVAAIKATETEAKEQEEAKVKADAKTETVEAKEVTEEKAAVIKEAVKKEQATKEKKEAVKEEKKETVKKAKTEEKEVKAEHKEGILGKVVDKIEHTAHDVAEKIEDVTEKVEDVAEEVVDKIEEKLEHKEEAKDEKKVEEKK